MDLIKTMVLKSEYERPTPSKLIICEIFSKYDRTLSDYNAASHDEGIDALNILDRYSFKINKNRFRVEETKDRFAMFRPQPLKIKVANINLKEQDDAGRELSPESMAVLSPINNKKSKYMKSYPNDGSYDSIDEGKYGIDESISRLEKRFKGKERCQSPLLKPPHSSTQSPEYQD